MYSFGIKKRTSRYKQNQTHNIHQLTILPDSFEWTHYLIMNMDLIDNNIITKEDAEKQFVQQADQKLLNDVTEHLVENTKFDLPAEFLTKWFTDNSPKWTTNYLIANEYTDEQGKLQQWVTSGHDLTLNVEGNEVKLHQVHDAQIVNGKVKMFYVYERVAPFIEE